MQNLKYVNRYPKLFKSAINKIIKKEIEALKKDDDNRVAANQPIINFRDAIPADKIMPGQPDEVELEPLREGLERLEEVSFDDALKSVSKQGKKMAKGYNYDGGREPDHNLDKMMIAFGRKVRWIHSS